MEVVDGVVGNAVDAIQTVPDKVQASAVALKDMIGSLTGMAVDFGLKLIAAVVVLVGGMWIARRLANAFRRALGRRNLDASLISFLSSFISITLRVFVIIISLATVGVQMTSIVAVLGAASLAIGMALSGTMQNFAGGIIIMFLKPFKVGDVITAQCGKTGTVKKIMIFTTEIHTVDNRVIFLPNGALANGEIVNLSHNDMRRTDLMVSISYGDSIDVARKEILALLDADSRILRGQERLVIVANLGDSAVVLNVRYWTKTVDFLATQGDVLEEIYKRLPKKKIHFPFPQMDVHISK